MYQLVLLNHIFYEYKNMYHITFNTGQSIEQIRFDELLFTPHSPDSHISDDKVIEIDKTTIKKAKKNTKSIFTFNSITNFKMY